MKTFVCVCGCGCVGGWVGGWVRGWVGGGGPEVVPVGSCQNEETRSRNRQKGAKLRQIVKFTIVFSIVN